MEDSYVTNLIHNEVYACISDMHEYLFDWDGGKYASYEDFDNIYDSHCPNCDEPLDRSMICSNCSEYIDADSVVLHPVEICEYWLVSPFLGELLKESGAPVLERFGAWIWGRTCSGQAIMLDGVIRSIASKIKNQSRL